jgi:Protein of unknown function (DUF1800)
VQGDHSGSATLERATERDDDTSGAMPRRPPVSRRTVLAGIAGSAALTACADLGPLLPGGGADPSPEPSEADPSAPPAPGPSAGGAVEPVLADDEILHLLRRTTFGPTAELVAAVRELGIEGYLDQQLAPEDIDDSDCEQLLERYPALQLEIQQIFDLPDDQGGKFRADFDLVEATVVRNVCTQRQLFEVMVEFWTNHFHVPSPNDDDAGRRTVADRKVYRAHALGRFADLLVASAKDPAMIRYLDSGASCFTGDATSVQENYGRELLELHTVGIQAGYTEQDVKNSAFIMTGFGVDGTREFRFEPGCHYPGEVQVLDFSHPNETREGGLEVAEAYLEHLAHHPATAQHVCTKLARRFVSDAPPAALVDTLAQTFLDNDTEIVPVLRALFASEAFRSAVGQKTKRPLEDVVSTARALGVTVRPSPDANARTLRDAAAELGQAPMGWGPPNGFPDVARVWLSSSRLLGSWNYHWDVLEGRYDGWLTPAADAVAQLDDGSAATVGALVDAVTERLIWQRMRPADREAVIEFTGMAENDPVGEGEQLTTLRKRIALAVFNSPYHLQR